MEHTYCFALWDICGTSYAPFPLDAPQLMQRSRKTRWWSSLGINDRCSSILGGPQQPRAFASTDQVFACWSRWPTSALG
jgi:hypothetical protein